MEDLFKNELFLRYFPLAAGAFFVVLFVSLGMWQLDRAREKNALIAMFDSDTPYAEPMEFDSLAEFDRIRLNGRYQSDRQVMIDNIPLDGRIGYYVITPFEPSTNDPLLLVNRGWVPKSNTPSEQPQIDVDTEFRTIPGMVGHLPRVAIRPGEAFAERGDWPRVALYPTLDEIAAELRAPVLPILMLLGEDAEDGFVRRWQPNVSGPMTHYSYAFQWFSLAVATLLIAGWQIRKRMVRERR